MDRDEHKCQKCGVGENLIIHHINGDYSNNKPANLIALCIACHAKLHHRAISEDAKARWQKSAHQQITHKTLERNLFIYNFCKAHSKDGQVDRGIKAYLGRKYSVSRERVRKINERMSLLMEGE